MLCNAHQTRIKGAAERGFNLPAARWRTLCQFQRFRWHPKGTLHILFFVRQTFQLHLPLKGRSAAVMWGLARHAGPLLYKLKKPPRTILSQLECSSVVRYSKGASLRKSLRRLAPLFIYLCFLLPQRPVPRISLHWHRQNTAPCGCTFGQGR